MKQDGAEWKGHARKVNQTLRPLQITVTDELMESMSGYETGIDEDKIRQALKRNQLKVS